MSWNTTPFVLLLFLSSVSSLALACLAAVRYRRQRRPHVLAFAVLCVGVAIWTVGYGVQLASPDLETKLALYRLLHLGGALVPPAWLAFALAYTGREEWLTARTIALASAVPLALLLAIPTDPWSLVVVEASLETHGAHAVLVTENGPLYLLFLAYSYVALVAGGLAIAGYATRSVDRVRRQSALLLAGVAVPLVLNLWDVLDVPPLDGAAVNPTPLSLALSVGLLAVAIFHYRLFDLAPVARRTVVRTIDEGVIVLDDRERVVDCNPAALDMLGVSDPLEAPIEALLPAYGRLEDTDQVLVDDVGADDRLLQLSGTPVGTAGAAEGWVLLLRDVTDLESRRRSLERQNRRLDAFAGTISHDLRNHMAVIQGYASLARDSGDPAHFERIDEAIADVEAFLEDLLLLAKQGRTIQNREPVSLAAVAADAMETVADGDATLRLETDATVDADRERLEQALSNLFRNAVDHGPADVTILVGDLPTGFFVADDGPGVPAEHRETVFEYGMTLSDSGTGLGLAIVREIVTAHGWEIDVTAGEDGGARFEVTTG